jgi:hypothetical protein
MNAEQRRVLEEHYNFSKWRAQGERRKRFLISLHLGTLHIRGWTLEREKRNDKATPPALHSLWRRGDSTNELLALDVFECDSVKATRDQLLEVLSNFESGSVERKTETSAPGDVAFGLGETMVLFARANLVILIRNAGPKVVPITAAAREVDAMIVRLGKSESSR